MVLLKYLSIFWRTLKRPLINCSKSSADIYNKWYKTFYISVITLSTQDNVKLLKQLESCFKRTINWNKYQSKIKNQARSRYLDFLIDQSFQGANRLFVLSFENENDWESYNRYCLPT